MDRKHIVLTMIAAALCAAAIGPATAQTMYKYRGPDGEWIYADRPPPGQAEAETRALGPVREAPEVSVWHVFAGDSLEFRVDNRYYAPVEVWLDFSLLEGVEYPHPDDPLRWVIPARSEQVVLDLKRRAENTTPDARYRWEYLPGDPSATPDTSVTYRAPFASGTRHTITQAYPELTTHGTPDGRFAIDFAMPIGTDVVAARDGTVFDVAGGNYLGGTDPQRFSQFANYVRVLHDDGTFAVYAHLNRSSIRVKPGDRVKVGDYLADSGNTGFTSGPHLHFVVQRNAGKRIESVGVAFSGPFGSVVEPATGAELTAYSR